MHFRHKEKDSWNFIRGPVAALAFRAAKVTKTSMIEMTRDARAARNAWEPGSLKAWEPGSLGV